LFRCGETAARKLVIGRDESERLKNGNTAPRFEKLIGRAGNAQENAEYFEGTMNRRRFLIDLRRFADPCLMRAR
jgi:hypothetical protein